ncbi:MAG TPA: nicotinate-nucleotide adenylyltransferase [Candidatus Acidoferrales bacterium]|nr:nicotinate-nucleotide adenylyltransferase [Candidatus Acidoferrales bacterium]
MLDCPPLRLRSLALFGGTFDPVHRGHMAAARAARDHFHLDAVHFVVAACPPHKRHTPPSPYPHRCAMVALACAGQPRLVSSLAEAGQDFSGRATSYSVDLVRAYRKRLPRAARLYFLIGADAFLEIGAWRDPQALLDACDFIVASRPGFPLEKLRAALPPGMLARGPGRLGARGAGSPALRLRRSTVHLISSVHVDISSTAIRALASRGRSIRGLVPAAVEDYICKQSLYR